MWARVAAVLLGVLLELGLRALYEKVKEKRKAKTKAAAAA